MLLIALALWPAALVSAQAADHPPDTMEARLLACAACHGRQGEGTDNDYFPRLAGKPAGYLMNQLVAFRDGRRRYPPMNYLLEYHSGPVSAEDGGVFRRLAPAAGAASGCRCQRGAAGARALAGDAKAIRPMAFRPAPVVTAPTLTGMEPAIPGLVGLHASYISAQLGALRYGTRDGRSAGLHADRRRPA